MKILIDMNLSPIWVPLLEKSGCKAVHWSHIGMPNAPDSEILEYARINRFTVFTHDLDFGSLLAATNAKCPSVIQVRTQDVTPESIGQLVITAIFMFQHYLENGALITVDEKKMRARILPLR